MVDRRLISFLSVAKPTRAICSPYNGFFTRCSTSTDIMLLLAEIAERKYVYRAVLGIVKMIRMRGKGEPILACAEPLATLGLLHYACLIVGYLLVQCMAFSILGLSSPRKSYSPICWGYILYAH